MKRKERITIRIEISESNGLLTVNGPALALLTDEEHESLMELGKILKSRYIKEVAQDEQKQDRQ